MHQEMHEFIQSQLAQGVNASFEEASNAWLKQEIQRGWDQLERGEVVSAGGLVEHINNRRKKFDI